ncbi:ArsR/SmtB family transcription factor [Phytohabitans rumicis]|uniref:ArsR/SmtB family transcription factor n=1 Tax=Phytohabitans rumicis TaxID=1076125 RepID=UPI0015B626C6
MTVSSRAGVLARFGHALSDPTRCGLLLALRDGPAFPADLADALGQGRRTRYELADQRLAHALSDLVELALAIDATTACPVDSSGAC